MKNFQFTLFVLLAASVKAKSRPWQDIVDHSIASSSNIDSSRYELKIETDPFLNSAEKNPSKIPTQTQQSETGWNLINSIKSQDDSMRPQTTAASGGFGTTNSASSFGTTNTASSFFKNTEESTEQNSGCENGFKYEIHMMDTWGDGWDKTMITITGIDRPTSSMETTHTDSEGGSFVSISKTIDLGSTTNKNTVGQIFQGSLQQGFHDFKELCLLPNQCYQLTTTGGEFSDEVSWELRPASNGGTQMEPMLTGGASTGCTFSPSDASGLHFCPNACSDAILENAVPPTTVENLQPEDAEIVQAEARSVVTPTMPVGYESASSSLGNSNSASTAWSKFKSGERK
mmetsp:Transcript_2501/g.6024  ORF Transcript_2501/g.6024 Transcript_2501/m.6024 type:complete len:344 (-) Transcript_2501:1958-2989(-)